VVSRLENVENLRIKNMKHKAIRTFMYKIATNIKLKHIFPEKPATQTPKILMGFDRFGTRKKFLTFF
jgi:hypothetical protein